LRDTFTYFTTTTSIVAAAVCTIFKKCMQVTENEAHLLKTSVKEMFYEGILAQNRTEIWGKGRQLLRFVITMQNGNR
jgi:hypothetical protein